MHKNIIIMLSTYTPSFADFLPGLVMILIALAIRVIRSERTADEESNIGYGIENEEEN